MNKNLQPLLTQLRLELEQIYHNRLVNMVLFGSQARGEADENSDIDVLIVLKGKVNIGEEIKRTSQITSDLSLKYNQVISRLFMDENQFSYAKGPLLRNIRKEGILL